MRVLLIDPPQGSVFQPYSALPCLKGYLQAHLAGLQVRVWDASIAYNLAMLSPEALRYSVRVLRKRLEEAESVLKTSAADRGKMRYFGGQALACAKRVINGIESAKSLLRDPVRFYDVGLYRRAMSVLEDAYVVLSARFSPFELGPTSCLGRLDFCDGDELGAFVLDHPCNPFREFFENTLIPVCVVEAPDLIGISVSFPSQVFGAFTLGALLKQRCPGTPVVIGGAFLSTKRRWMAANPWLLERVADFAVLGEGELPLAGLIEALRGRRAMDGIANLFSPHSPPQAGAAEAAVVEAVELPIPDYADFDPRSYLCPTVAAPLPIARGCYWHRCSFCTVSEAVSARYREMAPPRAVEAIESAAHQLKTDQVFLSVNCIRPPTMLEIARLIREKGLGIHWSAEARQDPSLTAEALEQLRAGGCDLLLFGLESASPRIRALIRKGVALQTARKSVNDCARAGIAVLLHFIVGFPGETLADLGLTIEFVRQAAKEVSFFEACPFILEEGSRVWDHPAEYGVIEHWVSRPNIFHEMERYRLASGLTMAEAYSQWQGLLRELSEVIYGPGQSDTYLTRDSVHAQLYLRRFGPFFLRELSPAVSPRVENGKRLQEKLRYQEYRRQGALAFLTSKEPRASIDELLSTRQANENPTWA